MSDLSGGLAGQDEISRFCGVGRTHVPRVLKPLLMESLIEEGLGRIPGISRRVKVYSLTQHGFEAASRTRDSLLSMKKRWKDEDGRVTEGSLAEIFSLINSSLTRSGMRPIPLSLILTMENDLLTWNDILWISNSIGKEEGASICLPEGWSPVTVPKAGSPGAGMEKMLEELDRIMGSEEISVLIGPGGMGKRTAAAAWVEKRGKKALWLAHRKDEGEIILDEGGFDLLIILEADMIDVGPSVLDGSPPSISDPRDERWPDLFRKMPLIGIQDGDLDIDIKGAVKATGIDRDHFISELVGLGLPEGLSSDLYSAVKGSPRSLGYIKGLSRERLDELISSDRETAALMVLLGSSEA